MNSTKELRLLGIFAHPDDETLGIGGSLAKYSAEGVKTFVLSATKGERGRFGLADESPGFDIVGRTRERELRAAAEILGVHEVGFLGYLDGDLDKVPSQKIVPQIAAHIRRIKPQVVVTFGPEGGYGHPDHIAISQFTAAGIVSAADSSARADFGGPVSGELVSGELVASAPHSVDKLYYMAWTQEQWDAYQTALKKLTFRVDGVERQANPWPQWSVTTRIDALDYWKTVWRAVKCHETQISIFSKLADLPDSAHKSLWGNQCFYRVFSRVNSGRSIETDLFAGLR